MALIQWLKIDFEFENEAGCLRQLVHGGWKQVNVITSRKGSVRGGHYHKYNTEAFYLINGSLTLTLWRGGARETYEIRQGDFFAVLPGVYHTFEYHEDTLLVSMYSNGVEMESGVKDIWTDQVRT